MKQYGSLYKQTGPEKQLPLSAVAYCGISLSVYNFAPQIITSRLVVPFEIIGRWSHSPITRPCSVNVM